MVGPGVDDSSDASSRPLGKTASAVSINNLSNASSSRFFSRRPAFLGGRFKTPKTTQVPLVSPSRPATPQAQAPPPAQSLVSPTSPTSPALLAGSASDRPVTSPTPSAELAAHNSYAPVEREKDGDKALTLQKSPEKSSHRRHASRHSISSALGDLGALTRSRSASLRTNDSSRKTSESGATPSSLSRTASSTLAHSLSPEKPLSTANALSNRPALSISTLARNKQKPLDHVSARSDTRQGLDKPQVRADSSKTPVAMAAPAPPRFPTGQKDVQQARRQDSNSFHGLGPAAPISLPGVPNPGAVFQHIHEMASKRISTLDYLRKSHEGRIYWFNTLLFTKSDLASLPLFTPRNLARRATHYLLLGFSLPTILDLNSSSPTEYLKTLNALLAEFEQYESMHPVDGSAPGSIGRGRIPGMQMFRKVNVGGKGRRSSSAADGFGFPSLATQGSFGEEKGSDAPSADDWLLPNESYSFLQTPSLPFDPDFFSTFITLCDVLIDCYTRILSMLSTPESVVAAGGGVPSVVGDLFSKADAKVRKIILAGVVREFEESCRQGVKAEVGGVAKVVLGGLM